MLKLIKWHRPEMINTIWQPIEWYTTSDGDVVTILRNSKYGEIKATRDVFYKCFK